MLDKKHLIASSIMFNMNQLDTKSRAHVIRCLVDGVSMRATSRFASVARNTIDKLLVELGEACSACQDRTLRNLNCKRIQVDECWAFVGCKQKQVTLAKVERDGICGDVWTWAGIDADTKLIPCWSLGQRDAATATLFVADLADRSRIAYSSRATD
jgi:transposase-like protein